MRRFRRSRSLLPTVVLLATLSVVAACGDADAGRAETTGGDEGGTGAPLADSTTRDLTGLNVCELLPASDVTQLLGGEIKTPASRSDYGDSQGCDYGIGPAGRANSEHLSVWVSTPELFQDAEAILETDRGLGQEASSEDLDGLGDVAFAVHNQTEQQTTVYVLRRGDVAISATAAGVDHARQLAQVILQRLGDR